MMENLLSLLAWHPLTKGCTQAFRENVADDLLSVIIRATVPTSAEKLDERVNDVYNDHFGVQLSNLFTSGHYLNKAPLAFSERMRVVRAMIQTMLVEESAITAFNELDGEGRGEILKRRLTELRQTENAEQAWTCLTALKSTVN